MKTLSLCSFTPEIFQRGFVFFSISQCHVCVIAYFPLRETNRRYTILKGDVSTDNSHKSSISTINIGGELAFVNDQVESYYDLRGECSSQPVGFIIGRYPGDARECEANFVRDRELVFVEQNRRAEKICFIVIRKISTETTEWPEGSVVIHIFILVFVGGKGGFAVRPNHARF